MPAWIQTRCFTKNLKNMWFHGGAYSCLHCGQVTSCFIFSLPLCICSRPTSPHKHNTPRTFSMADCRWPPTKIDELHFRRHHSGTLVSFSYRQHGDVCVHQVVCLHHVLRLGGRRLGGDHDHGADVLRQSRRTQEVRRVLQEAQF